MYNYTKNWDYGWIAVEWIFWEEKYHFKLVACVSEAMSETNQLYFYHHITLHNVIKEIKMICLTIVEIFKEMARHL